MQVCLLVFLQVRCRKLLIAITYQLRSAAFSHNKLGEIVKSDCPDCILLGPQVEYLYDETVANFGHLNIPISVIDQDDYGMMNGERVLKKQFY